MRKRGVVTVFVAVACAALASWGGPSTALVDGTLVSVETLDRRAHERLGVQARVALREVTASLDAAARLHGPDAPSYVKVFGATPGLAAPYARAVEAFIYRGALPTELKAAMGLRIAQVNGSPYVAAHMQRLLRGSPRGRDLLQAVANSVEHPPDERLGVMYADLLTRSVLGVSDEEFQSVRGRFDDAELVEFDADRQLLQLLHSLCRGTATPGGALGAAHRGAGTTGESASGESPCRAHLEILEIAASIAAAETARDSATQRAGLGLGMANSQRAMLRAADVAIPWRAFSAPRRGRWKRSDGMSSSRCRSRYPWRTGVAIARCTGLRRIGVEPAKLIAMRKDDSVLTEKERVAVQFARKLTGTPAAITDWDDATLRYTVWRAGRAGNCPPDLQLRLYEPLHRWSPTSVRRRSCTRVLGGLRDRFQSKPVVSARPTGSPTHAE